VRATEAGTLTFGSSRSRGEDSQDGYVRLVLRKEGTSSDQETVVADRAYLRMNEGATLEKMSTRGAHSQLYFENGGRRYAVANNEASNGAMPLYLDKADGTYSIEATLLNAECDYLHLVDNLKGNDIDLLKTPKYTFKANATDSENRFKLMFKASGSTVSYESFAYFNGSEWVIENDGEATLQVIDVLGRMLRSETVSGNATTNLPELSAGVYVLRLVNDGNLKVQKIVVE